MKNVGITTLAVTLATLCGAKADYLVLSSSFDQKEQETRLESFQKNLTPYGEPEMLKASNGAFTVAMRCKNTEEARGLRAVLTSRDLAPKDAYIVADNKLASMDKKAIPNGVPFIQVAASRSRDEAMDKARDLYYNEHWNGEVQVWASDADKQGKRWYRVVIPGKSGDQATALEKYLKTENVIDKTSFIVAESALGLRVFSTHEEGV
ncbi:MAG: SPOR domain-containing protein [Verrucomicrobiae bacterium]|nr:SPOR domain-containing protein [Verrucomicrobiae bacterium]